MLMCLLDLYSYEFMSSSTTKIYTKLDIQIQNKVKKYN